MEISYTQIRIKKLVATRLWPLCLLFLGALLYSSGAHGADIVTMPCKPTPAELAKARKALQNGYVVAMLDAIQVTFSGDLRIAMPQSAQDKYVSLNFMQEQRDWPQALLLHNTNSALDGDILVAGGVEVATGASNGQRIEVYNPATNTWSSAGNTTVARSGNTATLFGPVNVAAGKAKKSK
jgi:hypothetical protein